MRHIMLLGIASSFTLGISLAACDGLTTGDQSSSATGSAGAGNGSGGGESGAGGAGGGTGDCSPFGIWQVSYTGMPGDSCTPLGDTLLVEAGDDPGTVKVTFVGGEPPKSTCAEGEESKYVTSASLDDEECSLTASAHATWCMSGENQCDNRDLTLTFSGDEASGTMTYLKCWCGPDPFGTKQDYKASGTRKQQ